MIAVTSSPSALPPHHPPNHHENLHQYLSAQIRQLSPERSRASMGRTLVRQDNAQAVDPSQKSIRRTATEAPGRSVPNGIPAPEHDEIGTTTHGGDRVARPGTLVRSNTDVGPRRRSSSDNPEPAEDNWELRHGYDEQYNSAEYLNQLRSVSDIGLGTSLEQTVDRADRPFSRLFTCTIPTSGMRPAGNLDTKTRAATRLNGACVTD